MIGGCLVCDCQPPAVPCASCGWAAPADGETPPDGIDYPDEAHAMLAALEETSYWFRHRNRAISLLLERFPPGGSLWDVGGGNGFQARELQSQGHQVVLVEPSPTGCRFARERGVRHVFVRTLDGLALPAERVAAVGLFDVLEHLSEPGSLLGEIRRVLRPGGRLYVTVPAHDWLWSGADDDACHHRRPTAGTLATMLAAHGLHVVWSSYYFVCLAPAIALLRALPYRLGLTRPGRTLDPRVAAKEHDSSSLSARILAPLLALELGPLARGRIPFGSSILAVAEKAG